MSAKILKLISGFTSTLILLVAMDASANICGTDYQNFNPLTSGLDFVTVHSSETIEPCFINMGIFANYAVNSLTYTRTVGNLEAGYRPGDRLTSLDFNIGTGLTDRWDVGLSAPYLLHQTLDSTDAVSAFERSGVTEIRLNTKYRFRGDENGGLAGILSFNRNMISGNPFTGDDPGLTTNVEMAYDRNFEDWAFGVNLGYRKRNPGSAIPGIPIAPLGDQWIYSAAINRYIPSWDSKLIFEIYGSNFVKGPEVATDKNLNALEWLGGIKHDFSRSVALHFGGGTKVANSLASPDWRIYGGINWVVGPICDPATVFTSKSEGKITRFNVAVLFDTNSATIEKNFLKKLDTLVDALRKIKYTKITVEGHTDSVGGDDYNLQLSQSRAESVRRFLIEKMQIPPDKIIAVGYGEKFPVADNGNYQGRIKNRRVEIRVDED